MSDLPAINYQIVSQKLASKVAELTLQCTALENLAESLRTQRDETTAEVSSLRQEKAASASSAIDN